MTHQPTNPIIKVSPNDNHVPILSKLIMDKLSVVLFEDDTFIKACNSKLDEIQETIKGEAKLASLNNPIMPKLTTPPHELN